MEEEFLQARMAGETCAHSCSLCCSTHQLSEDLHTRNKQKKRDDSGEIAVNWGKVAEEQALAPGPAGQSEESYEALHFWIGR
jgi:hypothetical protein